jgi:hypothetical protein
MDRISPRTGHLGGTLIGVKQGDLDTEEIDEGKKFLVLESGI